MLIPLLRDMRVDLGRLDTVVPQLMLDPSNVRPQQNLVINFFASKIACNLCSSFAAFNSVEMEVFIIHGNLELNFSMQRFENTHQGIDGGTVGAAFPF